MRWIKKPKKEYNYRCVKRFALLPIKIHNEYRWLETCYIWQTRWNSWYESGWDNECFVDKNTYLVATKGSRICHDEECAHCICGHLCALQYNAQMDNNGICLSRREK